ncbi:hypothetical protein A2480_02405 [Candidatus Uhrbacteria bacterium RIFOXYC2_FULL_47_19]|uniref:Uncharacterized protein n=1 Tax=Candidatus Uhrbacteria bacterium RIFOXYC2_FULL_47_19 TaxID=1802424 RepID=A0A1F7WCK3_9BACT|nr:MAG: hypothetical protein A2480_02405 [Candidatus Uhrbacteria bacterium RIFOXYC2_FULL_47_19]HCC21982.1 hypothetical protein [Candidatus Uhrbacteria bacterium]
MIAFALTSIVFSGMAFKACSLASRTNDLDSVVGSSDTFRIAGVFFIFLSIVSGWMFRYFLALSLKKVSAHKRSALKRHQIL